MIDEPNVTIPLASSYNERGVAGYTHTVTNSEDQRKVNCMYELAKNPMTGKGTLTLAKRPGVTAEGGTYGTGAQTSYLELDIFTGGLQAVIYKLTSSGDIQITSGFGTRVILASPGNYLPYLVDYTAISNVQTVVLQLKDNQFPGVQRFFFSTVANIIANGAWTEITDADFVAFSHVGKMEHLDGFALQLTSTNLILNSDINSLANWTTATNFIAKQIRQDLPAGLARISNQILAFGLNSVEAFYNAGNTTGSPLGRIPQLHQKIGLVLTVVPGAGGTHYYATQGKKIYFVGRDSGGGAFLGNGGNSVGFFSYDQQTFEKVSSGYIDKILSEKQASIYSVNAMGIHGKSAIAICFTAPGVSPQVSLVFFPEWKEWFEWTSTVFSPVNGGDYFLGLGSNQNKIYSFRSTDNWQDDGTSYQWFTQFKLPSNGASRKFMPMYGVDADTDTSTNDLTIEVSDNDCASFSTLGTIDQTQDRKIAFRGGSFRKRHIRLGNTNARPSRIQNFLARID